MSSVSRVRELGPHYLAMLLCGVAMVGSIRFVSGGAVLVAEFFAMLIIAFCYPFAVRRLGYAPESWL